VSHPHILDCCSNYLNSLDVRRQALNKSPIEYLATWDSAAGCRTVATDVSLAMKPSAAICTKEAAALFGMKILVETVGNDRNAEVCYFLYSYYHKIKSCTNEMCFFFFFDRLVM
jgi:prephenate dehydratase